MDGSSEIPAEYADVVEGLRSHDLRVESVLGRGGVGVVFAATRGDEPVAVKLAWPWPKAEERLDDAVTQQRLRQPLVTNEGHALHCVTPASLAVCNRVVQGEATRLLDTADAAVVRCLGRVQVGPRHGYLMPRVPGGALPLTPGPALVTLARALRRLHEAEWPHGDLKPENVRVAEDGSVTLIDPLPIGCELLTPSWTHLNFLVASPLVDSADPRDRRMVARHRDLVAFALMTAQAFGGSRPWGHLEVTRILDRAVSSPTKRNDLSTARDRLQSLLPKVPKTVRTLVALALEPGIWPEEGPIFAAYLQARPFETRCDALSTLDIGALMAQAVG